MTVPLSTAGGLVSAAMQGLVASVIRTFLPLLWSLAITALGLIHFTVDDATSRTALNAATLAAIAYVWHLVGLLAERFGSSKLGWLFHGFASSPLYTSGNPYVANAVRTFVPYAAGALVVWASRITVQLDNATAEALITGLISGAITMGWYLIGRLGENFWSSKFGLILGFLRPPTYEIETGPVVVAGTTAENGAGSVVVQSAPAGVTIIGAVTGRHALREV